MKILEVPARLRRGTRILAAFAVMGYRTAVSYPANFVLSQFRPLFQILVFYFVAKLVDRSGPSVGGDYFTFVVLGWISIQVMQSGLGAFSSELNSAVQQGRFEMLLVEPIRWRVLPIGLVQWPLIQKSAAVIVLLGVSVMLGADLNAGGTLPALAVLLLGVLAALAIGVLSGSVVVLAKRGDPILVVYTIATSLLSGALFPLELLPRWLRGLSLLIPHTYVISALRRVLMPDGEAMTGPSLGEALVGLSVFVLVVFPTSLWLFGRAMEAGRRMGVLSGY